MSATPMPEPVTAEPVAVFCLCTSAAPIVLLSSAGVVVEPSTPHFPAAKLFGGGLGDMFIAVAGTEDGTGDVTAVASTPAPVAVPSASARLETAVRSMWPS